MTSRSWDATFIECFPVVTLEIWDGVYSVQQNIDIKGLRIEQMYAVVVELYYVEIFRINYVLLCSEIWYTQTSRIRN